MKAIAAKRVHLTELRTGIQRTPEFERKGLATHSVNAGTKCSHDCAYCSTGTMLRMHPSFGSAGESPFEFGYAIVDPETPERVAQDAMRIRPEKRGMIQLSTTVDAWAPESQEYEIGRRCLEAILAQERWRVRILTKNSAVAKEYDLIERHRDRVLVGLSLTGTLAGADRVSAIEPNASSIPDRLATLRLAHQRGLRTYAMLCPLLPGIADSPGHIRELVSYAAEFGAEEIFVEPVNPRGPGLRLTADALR